MSPPTLSLVGSPIVIVTNVGDKSELMKKEKEREKEKGRTERSIRRRFSDSHRSVDDYLQESECR